MSHRTNPIWDYFSNVRGKNKVAYCKPCSKNLSYRTSITNLKKHLKHMHIGQYNSFLAKSKRTRCHSVQPDSVPSTPAHQEYYVGESRQEITAIRTGTQRNSLDYAQLHRPLDKGTSDSQSTSHISDTEDLLQDSKSNDGTRSPLLREYEPNEERNYLEMRNKRNSDATDISGQSTFNSVGEEKPNTRNPGTEDSFENVYLVVGENDELSKVRSSEQNGVERKTLYKKTDLKYRRRSHSNMPNRVNNSHFERRRDEESTTHRSFGNIIAEELKTVPPLKQRRLMIRILELIDYYKDVDKM